MLEIIQSGGILMIPLLCCSVLAMAIIGERFWSLRKGKILPTETVTTIWGLIRAKKTDANTLTALEEGSPLGTVLVAGLNSRQLGREVMKEVIVETGKQVTHDLERYLNTLGTIAMIAPLLGLLGTVVGMIEVFAVITTEGVGDPMVLAGGISQALTTTAAGLSIAIPCVMFHRYFDGLVDSYVLRMEDEALKLIAVFYKTENF